MALNLEYFLNIYKQLNLLHKNIDPKLNEANQYYEKILDVQLKLSELFKPTDKRTTADSSFLVDAITTWHLLTELTQQLKEPLSNEVEEIQSQLFLNIELYFRFYQSFINFIIEQQSQLFEKIGRHKTVAIISYETKANFEAFMHFFKETNEITRSLNEEEVCQFIQPHLNQLIKTAMKGKNATEEEVSNLINEVKNDISNKILTRTNISLITQNEILEACHDHIKEFIRENFIKNSSYHQIYNALIKILPSNSNKASNEDKHPTSFEDFTADLKIKPDEEDDQNIAGTSLQFLQYLQ